MHAGDDGRATTQYTHTLNYVRPFEMRPPATARKTAITYTYTASLWPYLWMRNTAAANSATFTAASCRVLIVGSVRSSAPVTLSTSRDSRPGALQQGVEVGVVQGG